MQYILIMAPPSSPPRYFSPPYLSLTHTFFLSFHRKQTDQSKHKKQVKQQQKNEKKTEF